MSNITTKTSAAPAQAFAQAERVIMTHAKLDAQPGCAPTPGSFGICESSLPALDAVRPQAQVAYADLERQSRPATLEEITRQLARLAASFPQSGRHGDMAAFGHELLDYVLAAEPTIGDLDEARRTLVLNSKFLPSICETITAITAAKQRRERLMLQMKRLIDGRDRIVACIDKERQDRQEWEERNRRFEERLQLQRRADRENGG